MKKIRLCVIAAIAVFLAACGGSNQEENDNVNNQDDEADTATSSTLHEDNTADILTTPDFGDYSIIVNGTGTSYSFYTADGYDLPTHVSFGVIYYLGLDVTSAGSQMQINFEDGRSGVGLSLKNYLAFGDDVVQVGADDAFMDAENNFEVYLPISLFRELGFAAYYENGRVFIYGN
ncbi:MAG: hypothetical protein FWE44_03440 [Defluviitaleaceae bacterium]|nr:hypothetical protein [Defluviitaleaceae bacterium]